MKKLPNVNIDVRECPVCTEFITGRTDKTFCSDHCRNTFNNKLNRDYNNTLRNINNILRRNRRILINLAQNTTQEELYVNELSTRGFNFGFMTSVHDVQNEDFRKVFCYDVGYTIMQSGEVKIHLPSNITF